ncbi:hypothetical protein EGN72_02585 [Pseudorhodobacter sp. E13]|uniref:hypothetical protein n=1 Tax=Pseudorhodobacter sp. E13 TaxID=2487931 RepID=UPI000F8C51F5|nr:hypothetical protein [Pseudorhodobacter sp. E13]RUS64898.1 hypothetical protein EGN72_02585 [Pseudorhodobacter sp. E13]
MADVTRLTLQELTLRAARGLGKVDTLGHRGVTLVTADEVEAMAGMLALFGLVPVPPGGPVPERLIVNAMEGRK